MTILGHGCLSLFLMIISRSAFICVDHIETKKTHTMIPYSKETNRPFDKAMINTTTIYDYFEATAVYPYF